MSSTTEELTLNGSPMEPQMAVDKEDLDKSNEQKITHKDNRNLYLIKEGGMTVENYFMPNVSTLFLVKKIFILRILF